MITKPAYLVVDVDAKTIRRVTQGWPSLDSGEIAVRVELDIPGPPFNAVHQIVVEDTRATIEATTVPATPPATDDQED